jgi:hypothetical protein
MCNTPEGAEVAGGTREAEVAEELAVAVAERVVAAAGEERVVVEARAGGQRVVVGARAEGVAVAEAAVELAG